MINELASKLTVHGIDTSSLRPLDEVATENSRKVRSRLAEWEKATPIYTLAVKLDETVASWEQLATLTDDLEFSPVILGGKDSVAHHWDLRDLDAGSPESVVKAAGVCDAESWFQEQWEEMFSQDFSEDDIRGNFDEQAKPYTKLDISSLSIRPAPVQYIGFLPTTVNADLPAFLPFGGWNACPAADKQVCIHRYWNRLYQTQIVAMFFDTLICRVGAPVKDRDSALKLARQYMAYCEDSVSQGAGTLDNLAAGLINSTYWLFWWD